MEQCKALVVDDEYAARETICRLIDWEAHGFAPPVTAREGAQALALYQKSHFDLVFTDIEMPVMNGIDLIEQIRKLNPKQEIIVVSCHEKFEYARKAFKLGVTDYLVKDLLTPQELTALLASFHISKSQKQLSPAEPEDALCDILRLSVCKQALPDGFAIPYDAVSVLAVTIDDYEQICVSKGEIISIEQIANLAAHMGSPAFYYAGNDTFYLMFPLERNLSTLYYYNQVTEVANAVRSAVQKGGFPQVSIGVSNLCTRADDLEKACRQAEEAVRMRVLTGLGRTIIYDTITLRQSALDFPRMEYLIRCVEDFCYNTNPASLRLIDKLYDVELPTSFADIHYYRYINSRLWAIVLAAAKEQGLEVASILQALCITEEDIDQMESNSQMARLIKDSFLYLFGENEKVENDHLANRVLRLIEREYTQNISLSDIANRLHTNKSYLSRLFKEQTGDSIMNYIMKKKINRSSYLLRNTQMKLYEISDSLSFASPQYFSTVFKRYTGVSPNEYKKNTLKDALC